MAKKVFYGLKNVHYAIETDSGSALTYGTPVAIAGAVNWSCDARTSTEEFEADDLKGYYRGSSVDGLDITLEVAALPDSFLTDVMGATEDSTAGVVKVGRNNTVKRVALLWQRTVNVDGVEKTKNYVIYHALPELPKELDSETSASKAPKTVTVKFSADPNPYTGAIYAKTVDDANTTAANNWFTTVYTG